MKQPQGGREKRQFITENRTLIHGIQRGCELINLPWRASSYKPKHKPPYGALIDRIGDLCLEFPSYYGYRRVTKQLHREGWMVNHKNVVS
jgi:hypothetical protein